MNNMNKINAKWIFVLLTLFFLFQANIAMAMMKGIYISQATMENPSQVKYLISRAKKVGIHTFVVDLERTSPAYIKSIKMIKESGISYVARIIIFPSNGGRAEQVRSEAYWEKRYKLAQKALSLGADQIQLDYIRYNPKQGGSAQNAQDIFKIISWFKSKVGVPLQVDVFGVASFGPSKYIGQDIVLFSKAVDAVCPMVYPSHFEPYKVHAVTPYETVYKSLASIRKQFGNKPLPFKLIPYIELSNYRYPLSREKKLNYIYAQIQAAENANADGWYVWSPQNHYDNLFQVLETRKVR
jgi:hypothetical protein